MPKKLNGRMMRDVKILYNVPCTLRDGTVLYADVYRPNDDKPYPAIVNRTPYLKDNLGPVAGYLRAPEFAAAGYNVVIQDVRGTGHSEGICDPAGHQDEDGYDTIEAIAAMPWCDGQVGMVGESYHGFSQLACARSNPPHLKGICPFQTSWTKFPAIYDFGVFSPVLYGWIYGRCFDREKYYPGQYTKKALDKMSEYGAQGDRQAAWLPLKDMPAASIDGVPELQFHRDLLEHIDDHDYLASIGRVEGFEQVTVPPLCLTGWNDFLRDKTLYNFIEFQKRGGSETCRKGAKLIVGPWLHGDRLERFIEGIDYGPDASGDAIDMVGKLIQWYDWWMKGKTGPFMSGKPVLLFIMGENKWREENEWPLKRAQYTPWYFHSGGHANTLSGDGTLSPAAPAAEPADTYTYDPMNPCPSSTGDATRWMTQDQRPNETRDDVLVYTTPAFTEDTELTGPIMVKLYAASSAVDTDFAAKVSLILEDGYVRPLGMKLVRARYRNGEKAEPLTPGEIVCYTIEAANTALLVKAGQAIRVDITSSLFPDADRNMNTGGRVGYESKGIIARQTICHDEAHPSCVVLPVIPRA